MAMARIDTVGFFNTKLGEDLVMCWANSPIETSSKPCKQCKLVEVISLTLNETNAPFLFRFSLNLQLLLMSKRVPCLCLVKKSFHFNQSLRASSDLRHLSCLQLTLDFA